ncbi:hypothetical protein D6833_04920 [Candidatus Parcubacteria bacterium]|nr:MAG: hypothetical protein D6833_04920 [Candidatus Parcubacteria bacterium]
MEAETWCIYIPASKAEAFTKLVQRDGFSKSAAVRRLLALAEACGGVIQLEAKLREASIV